MGYIKEPEGIDLNISPMPYTEEDRQFISDIIAQYKLTKEIPIVIKKLNAKRIAKKLQGNNSESKLNLQRARPL